VYNLKASLDKDTLKEERAKCSETLNLITVTASDLQAYKDKLTMRRAFHQLEKAHTHLVETFDEWTKIKGESGEASKVLADQTTKVKLALQALEKEYSSVDKRRKQVHVPERSDVKEKQNELLMTVPEKKDSIAQTIKKHEEKIADDELFNKIDEGAQNLETLESEWIRTVADDFKPESEKIRASRELKKVADEVVRNAGLGDNRVIRSDKSSQSGRRETVAKARTLGDRLSFQAGLIIDSGIGVRLDGELSAAKQAKPSLISRVVPHIVTFGVASAVTAVAIAIFAFGGVSGTVA
jgi:hypothetical protein